jgi:GMP synthase-like glutamine amidotransferase
MTGVSEMICYIDIEHEQALSSAEKWAVRQAHRAHIKSRMEEISRSACLVRPYGQVTRQGLRASRAQALLISGNTAEWAEYDETDLVKMHRIIRSAEWPILGICGGCQLIAMAHGASLGSIRRLEEGEEDPDEEYVPGYFKEWGFVPLQILKSDPLFDGLGASPRFLAAHYWEVKEVPTGFDLLASSDFCRIQAIRQVGKPVYGTQFHPEAYTEDEQTDRRGWLINWVYPEGYAKEEADGRRLLVNFFRIAGILE